MSSSRHTVAEKQQPVLLIPYFTIKVKYRKQGETPPAGGGGGCILKLRKKKENHSWEQSKVSKTCSLIHTWHYICTQDDLQVEKTKNMWYATVKHELKQIFQCSSMAIYEQNHAPSKDFFGSIFRILFILEYSFFFSFFMDRKRNSIVREEKSSKEDKTSLQRHRNNNQVLWR